MTIHRKATVHWLDMLYGAAPRLFTVGGLIWAFSDLSHAFAFVCGVMVLYAWKVLKWQNKHMRD